MFIVTVILTLATALFFGAGNNNAPWANQVCRYGDVFCQHPSWLGIAAILSLIWALFLRVDRI
jgi:ABC-type transport system involved in multi-copper enzyme maturation permease subunit